MFSRSGTRVAAGMLAVASLLIAGCGSSGGSSRDTGTGTSSSSSAVQKSVRFTVFPGAFPSLGVYVADAMGYFKDAGIEEIKYVNAPTGSSAVQVLAAGDTDFIINDVTGVALARKQSNSDAVFVAGQFKAFDAALDCQPGTVPDGQGYPDAMKTIVDKKVGITAPGSATDTYLRYSMVSAGAEPKASNVIAVGGVPNLLSAFKATRVDCVIAYQPMQVTLTAPSTQTVVNWGAGEGPDIFHDYLFNGIATSGAYASKEPATAKAVSDAMKRAVEFASNPANAAQVAKATLKFFPGIEEKSLESAVRSTAPTFGYAITPTAVANALKVFNTINPTQKVSYPYDSFIAPAVRSQVGGEGQG